jgi:hypothetical protein
MSTNAQILANRENAQNSTGPTIPEGKAKVSRNAFQHGLNATNETLFAHDPALQLTFDAHCDTLRGGFGALDAALLPLFNRWAFASFQAQRAQKYEVLAEAAMAANFGDPDLERRWMRFAQMRLRLAKEADAAFMTFVQTQAAVAAARQSARPAVAEPAEPQYECQLPSYESVKEQLRQMRGEREAKRRL